MITENSTIFIIEDNKFYGVAVKNHLKKLGFKNVVLFHDEIQCLNSMHQGPEVLISDYQLNHMNGLKLFEEAKKKSSGFYSILLSRNYENEKHSNDMPIRYINRYIKKDGEELNKLSEVLSNYLDPAYNVQYY